MAMNPKLASLVDKLLSVVKADERVRVYIESILAVRRDFYDNAGGNEERWKTSATLPDQGGSIEEFSATALASAKVRWERNGKQGYFLETRYLPRDDTALAIVIRNNIAAQDRALASEHVIGLVRALIVRRLVAQRAAPLYTPENYAALVHVSVAGISIPTTLELLTWSVVLRAYMDYRKYKDVGDVLDALGTGQRLEGVKERLSTMLSDESLGDLVWNEFMHWEPPKKRDAGAVGVDNADLIAAIQRNRNPKVQPGAPLQRQSTIGDALLEAAEVADARHFKETRGWFSNDSIYDDDDDDKYMVVVEDGRYKLKLQKSGLVVGFVIATVDDIDGRATVVLQRVFINPDRRGQGLSTKLVTFALEDATTVGVSKPPLFGLAKIESDTPNQAYTSYVHAFDSVGYDLIEGSKPPKDFPAGQKWMQTLRFRRRLAATQHSAV